MLKIIIKRSIFFVIAIFVLSGAAFAISVDLPKTGQIISYSANDDGALQKGISAPSPRFTDHGDGTVTDNLTGLMWTVDANLAGTARTWQEALDFVKSLNSANSGGGTYGYKDWRLPNKNELRSLADHSVFRPAITPGHPFINIADLPTGSDYWTSTTDPYTFEWAWYVDLYDGDNYTDIKAAPTSPHWVWPVRGTASFLPATNQARCYDTTGNWISCANTGQDADIKSGVSWPAQRFTDNGDGTATDNLTGLLWTKDANMPGSAMGWYQALNYVSAMNNGIGTYSHKDWRLPNLNELASLVNNDTVNAKKTSAWLIAQGFSNVQEIDYWTSSTDAKVSTDAWRVFMRTGFENAQDKTNSAYYAYVWPVADSIIPVPASQQSFQYAPSASAAKSTNPSLAKPFGVGSIAAGGTTLSLEASAGKFAGPVDVYLAIYAPNVSPDIYMIMPNYTIQPLSNVGLAAFKTNQTGVNERLYGDIPTSSLPRGTYYLFVAVTPAGSTASYYVWQTNFVVQ